MRLLKAILAFAVEEYDLPENPAAKLKLGSDGERDAVPDGEAYDRLWGAMRSCGTHLHYAAGVRLHQPDCSDRGQAG